MNKAQRISLSLLLIDLALMSIAETMLVKLLILASTIILCLIFIFLNKGANE